MTTGKSLHHDVGQLLWVGFAGTQLASQDRQRIVDGKVGAAIVFKRNVAFTDADDRCADLAALVALNASLHAAGRDAPDPVLIAVDQEGGRVQRVRKPATVWPPMLQLDRFGRETAMELATEVGQALGQELSALGFDIDFAPVLDVHTNVANPIIGDRAFSAQAERVADLALAFAKGLDSAGILACGKHFPGHGDTHTDSHLGLPRLDHSRQRLEQVELLPFRRAAQAQVPMLMTAHIVFSAIDADRPATLSRAVITDLLRNDIGYAGVIVSDDLDMKSIADHYGAGDAAVAAIEAGCDAVLACNNFSEHDVIFEALVRAGEASASFRERIGQAASAVRRLKTQHLSSTRPRFGIDVVGSPMHQALAERIASDDDSGGAG